MPGTAKEKKEASFFQKPNIDKPGSLRSQLDGRRVFLSVKRAIDFLFSLCVIILVLSWLLPLLAILIKLDSRGPVFFVQRRVGFLGKAFHCIKLRTMIVNAYSDQHQAIPNDPRITGLGKFLRLTSLDELPQFLNVFIGDMSIVGPRPHMNKDNSEFGKIVENYRLRSFLKPGITGMAQVKGYRGPAKDFNSIFHRYQWDAFYVRNADPLLDIKIVRQTALQVMKSIVFFKNDKKKEKNGSDLILAVQLSAE
ncbi:MAG TPA: sugar transferase [Nitrosopumilaceae archaeon]|jgi:putative colanic acid biosynthesis UDP-glucose lipid carrier transferase|nr:sugar transferase [Nitrosopumilaceae archaeon]